MIRLAVVDEESGSHVCAEPTTRDSESDMRRPPRERHDA